MTWSLLELFLISSVLRNIFIEEEWGSGTTDSCRIAWSLGSPRAASLATWSEWLIPCVWGLLSFWCPGQWIMASSVGSQMASSNWTISCLFLIVFLSEVSKPFCLSICPWTSAVAKACPCRRSPFFPSVYLKACVRAITSGQTCPLTRFVPKWPPSGPMTTAPPPEHTWFLLEWSCCHPYRNLHPW